MATKHYRAVVKRIRESKVDVLVNLTCGMGGYICIGKDGLKDTPAPGSDFVTQKARMQHVLDLCEEGLYRPDIATLDCGTLNFGDGNRAYISTPDYCREGAAIRDPWGGDGSVRYRQPVVREAGSRKAWCGHRSVVHASLRRRPIPDTCWRW